MKLYPFFYTLILVLFVITTRAVPTQYDIDTEGNTPLHQVTDPSIAEQLLKQGVPINAKNNQGSTFLHYAVINQHAQLAHLALKYGAHINVQDHDGITPLMNAIIAGNLPIIQLLCAHGADITISDNENQTALDYANNALQADHSLKSLLIKQYLIKQKRKQQSKEEL